MSDTGQYTRVLRYESRPLRVSKFESPLSMESQSRFFVSSIYSTISAQISRCNPTLQPQFDVFFRDSFHDATPSGITVLRTIVDVSFTFRDKRTYLLFKIHYPTFLDFLCTKHLCTLMSESL